ncbi:teichoic acids export ABC transporter ATP-binding subunit TagH [Bacillus sp. J37]|uniref:teichoic acids export ABC transporter ATP-binding subunit TagH n=1 Tax=Bacillus sp. J37 TaxID=935837 RepID=UPI000479C4CF|nr:teichoic acids export ABC transporter ATP-binding subunit TagH [Bacillus sp. J37]
MKPKVIFSHVSKTYKLYKKNSDKLLDLFSISKKRTKTFYALHDISFEVYEGETIGIIGTNGSGKSTLSNLLSGAVPHSSGTVEINGEPSLIAIAAGLDKNLSGMDNIEQKCLMHGLKSNEIKHIKDDIIEFADLGDFIYQPVKNYSSGMKSRLGFAISVHTNPDILIIDEALSVGDQTFYQKCIDRIDQFKKEGKTIFFVSHSISQVKSISDRVIWIHFGKVKEIGETALVLKNYKEYINWFNSMSEAEQKKFRAEMMQKQTMNVAPADLSTTDEVPSRLNKTGKNNDKNRHNIGFTILIAILVLFTALSGAVLFSGQSLANMKLPLLAPKQSEIKEEDPKEEVVETIAMNTPGVIVEEQAAAYTSMTKSSAFVDIPFSTSVIIEEEYEEMYKIKYNNNSMYIEKTTVQLVDKASLTKEDSTIEQFESLLPEPFFQSYNFFIAFYQTDYDTLKEKINGYTEEMNEDRQKILHLDGYEISYLFNEDDITNEILIHNINTQSGSIEEFKNMSQISSNNHNQYLLITNQFEYILNLTENTLLIRSDDQ